MTRRGSSRARKIDWTAVRARLAEAMRQVENSLEEIATAPESARSRLRQACDDMAARGGGPLVGAVSFSLCQQELTIEISFVCEIVSKFHVTPLPSAPPHVMGIHNLRGQLLPIFDLRRLLGLPCATPMNADWALAIGSSQPEFLILSDTIPKIVERRQAEFRSEPADGTERRWYLPAESGAAIDGHLLLQDSILFIGEELSLGTDAKERK